MSTIASKNLYDLLGNDPELDPDREPEPPTKVLDKPVQRTGKRNAGPEAPARDAQRPAAGGRGGRQVEQGAPVNNRSEQRDDGLRNDRHSNRTRGDREYHRGEGGRGRGGRGRGRGDRGAPRDDRHSHTGLGEHEKQAAQGWGAEQDGNAEWADEKAGDAIARAEVKNDAGFTPDASSADPAFANGPDGETSAEAAGEPEEKTKSYDEYLAEQAEKRLALSGNATEVRKANEGSKQKFPEGKAFTRDPEAENFMIGSSGKARKAKETTAKKEHVLVDGQYYAPADSGDRGGSRGGRGRGGRGGRGEFRGDRGGRGRGRGSDSRGGARGDRDSQRASRGGAAFNATDESAFPALGGS